jgi:hypothetical protein
MTDGQQFPKLVKKDEEVGVEAEVYAGDKGYDDGENHELLTPADGLLSTAGHAIMPNCDPLAIAWCR